MDINEIQDLIKFVSKSGANEVELETKDFRIIIKANGGKGKNSNADMQTQVVHTGMPYPQMPMPQTMPMPNPAPAAAEPAQAESPKNTEKKTEDDAKYITVKSPIIGTFYRSPSPDKPPFVAVGDDIKEGDTICIIEAMKLFNEIESEVSGKIVKVLVEDSTPVEYDQPLFLVDPK